MSVDIPASCAIWLLASVNAIKLLRRCMQMEHWPFQWGGGNDSLDDAFSFQVNNHDEMCTVACSRATIRTNWPRIVSSPNESAIHGFYCVDHNKYSQWQFCLWN